MIKLYGTAPVDLGLVDIDPSEMMCWVYCPISIPGGVGFTLPANLEQFTPILKRVWLDLNTSKWNESYVYITAKTLWVTPENPGNRPGWHSDGFMTDDLNYIWSNGNPTLFWEPEEDKRCHFKQHHTDSLREMEIVCESDKEHHCTYPDRHLLKLDELVMHRVNDVAAPGFRTFVKISVSKHEYRLKGNSVNHGLNLGWSYEDRKLERNTPEVR